MGSGIIGKIIYYWIFVLGILFMAKFFGFANDTGTMVITLIIGTLVYVGWQLIKYGAEKKG
jgi:hypothetical protein